MSLEVVKVVLLCLHLHIFTLRFPAPYFSVEETMQMYCKQGNSAEFNVLKIIENL